LDGGLQVQLRNMPEYGWQWCGEVSAAVLQDAGRGSIAPLPPGCSGMYWIAALQRKGDCYHLSGKWRIFTRCSCARCNAPVEQMMSGTVMRDFRMGNQGGDEDVLPLPGAIDLVDVLREEVWLAWPHTVLCSPECKGLCPQCGQNLNQAACNCTAGREDHPFAVLGRIRLKASDKASGK